MLRERIFAVGAGLLVALGLALVLGLLTVGAGSDYAPAYLAGGVAWVLAALFYHVARESRAFRLEYQRSVERGSALPPGGPPR